MTSTKVLYKGFHKIIEVEAEMKGKRVTRERIVMKHAVGGCVVDENGKVALVTQYRPAAGCMAKEIPAGLLDKEGLRPIDVLIEELFEECEIQKEEIVSVCDTPFHEYFVNIGSSDGKIALYDIRVTAQTNKTVKDADVESVEWVDLTTFKQYIDAGLIQDPKTLLTYYYLTTNEMKGAN